MLATRAQVRARPDYQWIVYAITIGLCLVALILSFFRGKGGHG